MVEEEVELPLHETTLCVRYTGTSDVRRLSHQDLLGPHADTPGRDAGLEWTSGSDVPYALWEMFAGSRERAMEVLQKHAYEFQLVGPGAEDIEGEEEFSFEEKG